MKKSFTNILLIFLLSVIVIGCSRKKDKFLNKNFHSLTTKYNFLFNGNNLYAEGLIDLENEVKENFWGFLPIDKFIYYDIDAPYSCRGGACASCIGRLKSGTVELEQNYILTDSEIDEGLILTCQAYPTSEEIYFDSDDI